MDVREVDRWAVYVSHNIYCAFCYSNTPECEIICHVCGLDQSECECECGPGSDGKKGGLSEISNPLMKKLKKLRRAAREDPGGSGLIRALPRWFTAKRGGNIAQNF